MQEKIQLKVDLRSSTGKGISRKLRAAGLIPGVVYGRDIEPVAVSVAPKALQAAISGEGGINNLITLQCGGQLDQALVIVADMQRDPLKGTVRHVDLQRISMKDKIKVNVPVVIVGTAVGVKEGGLLDLDAHTLHIECLPDEIPEHIEVDVSNLEIGQTIHLQDITLPANIRCLDKPTNPLVSILGRAKTTAAEEETEEETTEE